MNEVHRFPSPLPAPDAIAAEVASRICHDLVSPLGAIANGVELMGLTGTADTPEMALIRESVDGANARIRFFRLAYGAALPDQRAGRAEILAALQGASRAGRTTYEWNAAGDQPRAEVRAVFLILQCLESAMPMGGVVRVAREGTGWHLEAEGPRLRVEDRLWDRLAAPHAPQGAGSVQFALLPLALAAMGRVLSLDVQPDRIVIHL